MSTLDRRERANKIMTYNILNHRAEMDDKFMKMNKDSRTAGRIKKLKISQSKLK